MTNLSAEAQRVAYATGVRELGPLVQRVLDLEAAVQKLNARVDEVERKSVPAHMRNVERRA